jgi:DNA-binding CsgD family transcriptional regulator
MGKRGRPRSPDLLTPREQEVLALLRAGLTNEQIASRLDVSPATAKYHVSEILSKLGVGTREEAAAWAPEVEGEGWTWRRWALVGLGTATVVGTMLVLGLLAWGVFGTDEEEGDTVAAVSPSQTPEPLLENVPLTATSAPPSLIAPSPDGAWPECPELTVEDLPDGLHLMDRGTCELSTLTDADNVMAPTWSPDGKWIAYLRLDAFANPGASTEIMLAAADGSGVTQLTDTPELSEGSLVWSPDSKSIAFTTFEQTREIVPGTPMNDLVDHHDLVVLDVDSGVTRLMLDDEPCSGWYHWTTDQRHLLIEGCSPTVGLVDLATGGKEWLPEVTGVLAVHPTEDLVAYKCPVPVPQPRLSGTGVCLGGTDGSLPGQPINRSQFSDASPFSAISQPADAILAYDAAWIDGGGALVLIDWGLYVLPMDGSPGRHYYDWRGSFIHWASRDVVVSSECRQPSEDASIIPCPTNLLVSYNLNSGEARTTLAHSACHSGGSWSPDGQKLAITTIVTPCPG